MKYVVLVALFLSLGCVFVMPVFATSATPMVSPVTEVLPATTQTTAVTNKTTTQVANLQKRAESEIDRRIIALQAALTKIGSMKKIPESDKATLTTAIQSEITKLTDLKTKISAATDLVTLKADVATIVTQYRIFALFLPKIHLLSAADVLGSTIDELTILASKLQTRITAAESAGMSVTSLTTTHKGMLEKIADASKQYESILTNVTPLVPDGYPGNKSTLTNARTLLTTARKNIVGASQDAKTIMNSIKAFRPTDSTSASSSATPSVPAE